jgi:signal transduction histidine kinase
MATLTFIAALFSLAIGTGAVYANPSRFVNRIFGLLSLNTTLWLIFVFLAHRTGALYQTDRSQDPVLWLRAAAAAGTLFPWLIWLLKEAILTGGERERETILRSWGWFILVSLLALLCFTEHFIPSGSTPDNPRRGAGYLVYAATNVVMYLTLGVIVYRQMQRASGVQKIELQVLAFNCAMLGSTAITLTAIGNYSDMRFLSRLSPLVVLGFYALTAWAITFHRVFDARQVLLNLGQQLTLILSLCLGVLASQHLLSMVMDLPASLILSVALVSSVAFYLEHKTREWFRLSPEENIAALRRTLLDQARTEPNPEKLIGLFEGHLRAWGQAGYARLLFDSGEIYATSDLEFAKDRPAHAALCRSGWSTPESLQRQRAEPGLVDLRQFLTEFNLGLIVSAPRNSANPSLLLVIGTKVNHRPFTYPEVQQAQEIAEFMDNILARSRLTLQARQSEQLATIGLLGASLAHEIRNPLVSIKTFASLLATRYDDAEFRRRFSLLIPAEVERIDSLTQQLLDLSNPRRHQMERTSLHTITRETVDLMLTRATESRVAISATYGAATDTIWADASAIRQVLINLLINAFQALEHQDGERRVELRTRNSPGGSIIIEIADNGPGIPPDQRAKLFHPFASTKTKGMGLGLAVCADILHEHKATIIVPDIARPGATFRITFPCPPSSS